MNVPKLNSSASDILVDQFSRTISYLRLSLTDRCNLRCHYCMPCDTNDSISEHSSFKNIDSCQLLTYEELLRIVNIAVKLGMKKIRLTGGEPLIRRGVMDFIQRLALNKGLEQIRLTTNGVLLEEKAEQLYGMGVRHLNISLDTLNPQKFTQITGRDFHDKVWRGIQKALQLGFNIKINVVAMRGINDDEFVDFARLALLEPLQVRFIEFMPVGKGSIWKKEQYISSNEIEEMISTLSPLEPFPGSRFEGPARMFTITDGAGKKGKIGLISPLSHHFCDQCNRLRITSEGKIRACLLNDGELDLKSLIRNGCSDLDIENTFRDAILHKPKGHGIDNHATDKNMQPACMVQMSRIGG